MLLLAVFISGCIDTKTPEIVYITPLPNQTYTIVSYTPDPTPTPKPYWTDERGNTFAIKRFIDDNGNQKSFKTDEPYNPCGTNYKIKDNSPEGYHCQVPSIEGITTSGKVANQG